jgi:hypothetical protein
MGSFTLEEEDIALESSITQREIICISMRQAESDRSMNNNAIHTRAVGRSLRRDSLIYGWLSQSCCSRRHKYEAYLDKRREGSGDDLEGEMGEQCAHRQHGQQGQGQGGH